MKYDDEFPPNHIGSYRVGPVYFLNNINILVIHKKSVVPELEHFIDDKFKEMGILQTEAERGNKYNSTPSHKTVYYSRHLTPAELKSLTNYILLFVNEDVDYEQNDA